MTNVWRRSEIAKKFVLAKRFAKIAADLMGVDGVRIYHDQALYKEAQGGHTPWHQDQFYWPLETKNTITMWMPMVDITSAMGMMEFVPNSHHGELINISISGHSDAYFRDEIYRKNLTVHTYDSLKAGDATFHNGWTLHRTGPNLTKTMREVMTIIFVAHDAVITEPKTSFEKSDLEAWFPGQKPGETVGSELNPLVYHRSWDNN